MGDVIVTVNRSEYIIRDRTIPVATTLLEYLREHVLLPGTKAGCNVGGCGACTVMVSEPHCGPDGEILTTFRHHRTVNACCTPVLSLHGCSVTTIEGLGDVDAPHPIQERFATLHASQCGYCTPGMAMSLFTLLLNNPNASSKDVEKVFNGNLCRCTGYRPLLDAAKSFALDIEDLVDEKERNSKHVDPEEEALDAEPENSDHILPAPTTSGAKRCSTTTKAKAREIQQQVPVTDESFDANIIVGPPSNAKDTTAHMFHGSCGTTLLLPTRLSEMQSMRSDFPDCMIISGNAGFLRVLKERVSEAGQATATIMWTGRVNELHTVDADTSAVSMSVGSAVTFSSLTSYVEKSIEEVIATGEKDALCVAALKQFKLALESVGSTQSRNTTTVVGHVLGKPAGDLVPFIHCLGSTLTTVKPDGTQRTLQLSGGNLMIDSDEIITRLNLPSMKNKFVGWSKASMRNDNSIGQCVVAMALELDRQNDGADVVVRGTSSIACAGAAVECISFPSAAALLQGVSLKADYLSTLRAVADELIPQLRNAMYPPVEGRAGYRVALARGMIFRLFNEAQIVAGVTPMDESLGGISPETRFGISSGHQAWEETPGNIHTMDHNVRPGEDPSSSRPPVGVPVPCVTGLPQATGQAVFVDDIPTPAGCLFGSLVKSTIPKGKIKSVDASKVLNIPGVKGFYDYNDVPNQTESPPDEEHAFCHEFVSYIGDVIGVVVATSQVLADRAAKLVHVEYELSSGEDAPCFDIDAAIERKSFMKYGKEVVDGDVDAVFKDENLKIIEGVQREGGQEHFYMEPHALLVIPGEHQDIEIVSMTQCVTKTQKTVANTLGIPASKVNVKVKRIGGAFGGKEVRSTFTAATLAVAATKLKRPIRWRIQRDEDMRITGGRHPYRGDWKVAIDPKTGSIKAMDVTLYANGGCTTSATSEVMTRSLMHITNAYKIPAVRVRAYLCLTNIVSNTAYRGFGAPQAMLVVESMIEAISKHCNIPVETLQHNHLMKVDSVTHYGQEVKYCKLDEMWKHVMKTSDFEARLQNVEKFNSNSRYIKRGLAIVPTLYGINFPVRHLNQGGALVSVYLDGTASISHHAVEMGQGINTKCAQVAAQSLGIPVSDVHVADCSIDKVPNTPPTAASMGSDLACMAVLDACEKINERIQPVKEANPGASFKQICTLAWKERICLASEGHYKTKKGAQYDWKMITKCNEERGPAFSYHVFGVGCSEVEVDVITGHFKVLRTDLLMDCGDPLNPAIDVGQVEGAFIQGMGWLTTEELIFGDTAHPGIKPGLLHSAGPHEYKIPAASDVPIDFRLELLSGAPNPFAVHGSKAVGEPPLFLAASVFYAIKKAIYAARQNEGLDGYFSVDSPLTSERIRMACRDEFTAGAYGGDVEYLAAGSF